MLNLGVAAYHMCSVLLFFPLPWVHLRPLRDISSIYIYVYIYMQYICTHTHTHARTHIHTYIYNIYIYIYIYVCIYDYITRYI